VKIGQVADRGEKPITEIDRNASLPIFFSHASVGKK